MLKFKPGIKVCIEVFIFYKNRNVHRSKKIFHLETFVINDVAICKKCLNETLKVSFLIILLNT